jgi:hypothetical protein
MLLESVRFVVEWKRQKIYVDEKNKDAAVSSI